MQRRLVSILTILLLLFSTFSFSLAVEQEVSGDDVLAPNYIVVDASDPTRVIYARNPDESSIPGSTMKIMTCILSLELAQDLDERITVPGNAANLKESNSLMGVIKGEDLSIRELLYGLMLESGNDAALTLALHFGGDVEGFATLMNAKAKEIGMSETTHFVNASGAFKRDQRSTARDMAILTCYALQNETFRQIVSTVNYTVAANTVRKKPLEMTNSNRLISDPTDSEVFCPYANGVKTGSTELGGKCLVSSASMDGVTVVAVLLGAKEGGSKNVRMTRVFKDAKRLMEQALDEEYTLLTPESLGLTYTDTLPLDAGDALIAADFSSVVGVRVPNDVAASLKTDISMIEAEPTLYDDWSAEVGQTCGELSCLLNGSPLFSAPIVIESITQYTPTPEPLRTTPAPSAEPTASPQETMSSSPNLLLLFVVIVGVAAIIGIIVLLATQRKNKKHR